MDFLKKQLEKVQNSSDREKKRWLIILSGISIIAVIFSWIFYMNNFVIREISSQTEETVEMDIGFWQVFKTGLAITEDTALEKIKNAFNYIIDKIPMPGKSNVTIENPR